MKRGSASFAMIVASDLCHDAFAQSAEDLVLVESRAIVEEFAQTLQGALQPAMSESAPAAAIDVCRIEALEIASELSRRHGARVGRTSKTRNSLNLPTSGLCLVCHGTTIPADVAATPEREHPFDAARGYEAGDVRGAFGIVWPQPPKNALLRGQDGSNAAAQ